MADKFYANDIERILKVKRQRLEAWQERGYFSPSIQKASGPGTRNIYSRGDLYGIWLFERLLYIGVPRKVLGELINSTDWENLEKTGYNFAEVHVGISDENGAKFEYGGEEFSKNPPFIQPEDDADAHFIINIRKIFREVDSKIE